MPQNDQTHFQKCCKILCSKCLVIFIVYLTILGCYAFYFLTFCVSMVHKINQQSRKKTLFAKDLAGSRKLSSFIFLILFKSQQELLKHVSSNYISEKIDNASPTNYLLILPIFDCNQDMVRAMTATIMKATKSNLGQRMHQKFNKLTDAVTALISIIDTHLPIILIIQVGTGRKTPQKIQNIQLSLTQDQHL